MSTLPPRARRLVLILAAVAAGALLCLWPMRDAVVGGGLPGAGPDVVESTWAMWWAGQVGPGRVFGSWTDLVNHPAGAHGSVLAHSAALVHALSAPWLGLGPATTLAALLQLLGLAGGVAWAARTSGASAGASALAGLVVLAARYPFHALGEGSVVAIAALPLVLGIVALLRLSRHGGLGAALLAALCLPWLALENPYLVPILGLLHLGAAAGALRAGDRARLARLAGSLLAGSLVVLAVLAMTRGAASPDYPPAYPEDIVGPKRYLGPLHYVIADTPWSRSTLADLFWPGAVHWTVDASDARFAPAGGRFLGLVGSGLALASLVLVPHRAWRWLALGALGIVLSMGSLIGALATPFGLLNQLLDVLARPVTQPSRYLIVALIGLAVAAAHGWDVLHRRHGRVALFLPALLLGEALLIGGPSLRLPTTRIPTLPCAGTMDEGAVLAWPDDASDRWPAHAKLLQTIHGRPTPHWGVAGWLRERPVARKRITELGFDVHSRAPLETDQLQALGFRWVIAEPSTSEAERAWLSTVLGPPVAECSGHAIHDLADAPGPRPLPPRSRDELDAAGPPRP